MKVKIIGIKCDKLTAIKEIKESLHLSTKEALELYRILPKTIEDEPYEIDDVYLNGTFFEYELIYDEYLEYAAICVPELSEEEQEVMDWYEDQTEEVKNKISKYIDIIGYCVPIG